MKYGNLNLPAHCTILNEENMRMVEGGGIVSSVLYALGRMFSSTRYETWSSEAVGLQQAHGEVVSYQGGVYTYSDGYTYSDSHGWSFSTEIGDFLYGLGQLFAVFGL